MHETFLVICCHELVKELQKLYICDNVFLLGNEK